MNQAEDYASTLRIEANLPKSTTIVAYVLGSSIDTNVGIKSEGDDGGTYTYIYPLTYERVLNKAHHRTFHLIKKIKEIKRIGDTDKEMKKIIPKITLENFT